MVNSITANKMQYYKYPTVSVNLKCIVMCFFMTLNRDSFCHIYCPPVWHK